MGSLNALMRALLLLCAALGCTLALEAEANADDAPPRAVPRAGAYPRSFRTYDALAEYALGVARTQGALDSELAAVRTERASRSFTVDALIASRSRGGSLFETFDRVDTRLVVATHRARLTELVAAETELIASGALTTAEALWRLPTVGRVTQRFGSTRLALEPPRVHQGVRYAHFHEGVDLAGAWMAPVTAPARGRVVFAGIMPDGGMVVVLAHDGGMVSLYAHLDARSSPPPVRSGDEVAVGQRIGTVGNTGISTGPHLHWAVWRDGALIDPLSLVGDSR